MPLFNCTSCSAVENTALSNYWTDLYQRHESVPFNPVCSKCDPRIGEWHGRFPRNYEPVADQSLAPGAPRLLNAMRSAAPCDEPPQGEDAIAAEGRSPASTVGEAEAPPPPHPDTLTKAGGPTDA